MTASVTAQVLPLVVFLAAHRNAVLQAIQIKDLTIGRSIKIETSFPESFGSPSFQLVKVKACPLLHLHSPSLNQSAPPSHQADFSPSPFTRMIIVQFWPYVNKECHALQIHALQIPGIV